MVQDSLAALEVRSKTLEIGGVMTEDQEEEQEGSEDDGKEDRTSLEMHPNSPEDSPSEEEEEEEMI